MEYKNTKDTSNQYKSYLIFGASKTGKTRLASTLPQGKMLLINTENNLDSLHGADITYVTCQTYKEFIAVLDDIEKRVITPEWLYIDSLSDLLSKIFNNLKKENSKDGFKIYKDLETQYVDIISKFKNLPCNIVAIGRQGKIKDEITGGLIFGATASWDKLTDDLPFNFSAVLATRNQKGQDGKDFYAIQCLPCSQYQVGVRTQFGKPNPLNQYEEPDLMAIHNKITNQTIESKENE